MDPLRPPNRWLRRIRGYQFELVKRATEEWDELFERSWIDYGYLVRRNRAYVQWRYLDCPDIPYIMIAVRRWRRLVGWVVLRIRDHRLSLGDALFAKNGHGAQLRSVDLDPATVAAADCVVILVCHTSVDYDMVLAHARLVFDAVNATAGREGRAAVERL